MKQSPPFDLAADLNARLGALGAALGAQESEHAEALSVARSQIEALRVAVASGIAHFHAEAARSGAPHIRIEVSGIRTDDKHLRSLEFDLIRGCHKAIVTVKSRREITLVGPFCIGKAEGPCQSFAFDAQEEIAAALGDFLEAFLQQASSP